MPAKIYFFNDTSLSMHAGCKAVMRSLRHNMSSHFVTATHYVGTTDLYNDALEDCDLALVNGEGTIHHDSPRANFLLEVLRTAQSKGKKTALINALYQQYDDQYRDVLEALDLLVVREPRSAELAREHGGHPIVLLDSAADPTFLEGRGRVVAELASVTKGATHPHAPLHGILDSLDVPRLDVRSISYEDLVETLATTQVYVTGQHHGIYAAALAGTPFVPIASNSHKIESFLQWSGLHIPMCESADDLQDRVEWARSNPAIFLELQNFIQQQRVFNSKDLSDVLKI